MINDLIKMNL